MNFSAFDTSKLDEYTKRLKNSGEILLLIKNMPKKARTGQKNMKTDIVEEKYLKIVGGVEDLFQLRFSPAVG
ncbi:hypothetical protein [Butyrivibrio sp. YAB3001]|uniref:hypothetical protein n=1 Tax=Butyrivibrio sp. YAB3001 TaxID=1520812 RepID=UPI0008F65975|nr:hypothetical protein [Butyrivibrio sp. YAB3001]SFC50247.1 hypothetical protein SAMN02910398_02425 [Butyrivibrio sp. YAB3001]